MSYRVKTVCGMTGISRPTLLAWERRYDLLEPRRSATGHRIYVDEDVDLLKELKGRVDAGLSIGEAVRVVKAARAGRPSASEGVADGTAVADLAAALTRLDRPRADRLVASLHLPFHHLIDDLYAPLIERVDGRGTGPERFAAGWLRERMFALLHALGSGPTNGAQALCAAAPGEVAELAALALALHLALDGWRVAWLGGDLPIEAPCALAAEHGPALVCLWAAQPHPRVEVARWAATLRAAAPRGTEVAIGGACVAGVELPGVLTGATADALRAQLRRTTRRAGRG